MFLGQDGPGSDVVDKVHDEAREEDRQCLSHCHGCEDPERVPLPDLEVPCEPVLHLPLPEVVAVEAEPGRPFDHNSGGHTRSVHETKHTWPIKLFMAFCSWDLVVLDHPTHLEHKRLSHTKPSSRKHHSIKNF